MNVHSRPVLITGGTVHVMDDAGTRPEAVLLADGRVWAVGRYADLARRAGDDATRIDLQGATALPGLVDTHPHLLHFAARRGTFVELGDARDHAEILDRIRTAARTTAAGDWIHCTPVGEPYYYHRGSYRDLAERRLPRRAELDRATTEHPVMIQAWGPRTPNVVAFNSAALDRLDLTDHVPDRVCDVWIEKDDAGRITGLLRGSVNTLYSFDPYWTQLLTKVPRPVVDVERTTRAAMADYNAMGVTTVYEAHNMTVADVGVYERLRRRDAMTVRVMAAMETEVFAHPPFRPLSLADYRARLDVARSLLCRDDDWFRVEGATLAEGGPCWSGCLRTLEPSLDPYGRPSAAFRFASRDKVAAFARYCLEHGMRANFLAVGHVDHDDVLDVLDELTAEGADIASRGWLLQHSMLISEAQSARFAALGFAMTTSMSFPWGKGDVYGERIGRYVWRDLVPLARLLRQGMNVAGGSDWGPKGPFDQIALAQTHEFGGSGYRNDTPDHAVSRRDAVAMWTRRAGEVLGWPGVGTLEPGAYADVAIVDRDPLTCAQEDLPGTTVLRTLLGGTTVHGG